MSDSTETKRSICRIIRDGVFVGMGFFVQFPIPSESTPICGIMTNNHVLPFTCLVPGSRFAIEIEALDEEPCVVCLTDGPYVFASELIDVTFVQLDDSFISKADVLYLTPRMFDCSETDESLVASNPAGKQTAFEPGRVLKYWGCDYLHTIDGSPGSPFLDDNLHVVGVHKGSHPSDNLNTATRISVIWYALRTTYNQFYSVGSIRSRLPARHLSDSEIAILERHGFHRTCHPNVFITSPISFVVTPLLFYRTNHAWYWTPLVIDDFTIASLKTCNWSIVIPDGEIKAIGGLYNGYEPASINVSRIKWLMSTGPLFLS